MKGSNNNPLQRLSASSRSVRARWRRVTSSPLAWSASPPSSSKQSCKRSAQLHQRIQGREQARQPRAVLPDTAAQPPQPFASPQQVRRHRQLGGLQHTPPLHPRKQRPDLLVTPCSSSPRRPRTAREPPQREPAVGRPRRDQPGDPTTRRAGRLAQSKRCASSASNAGHARSAAVFSTMGRMG